MSETTNKPAATTQDIIGYVPRIMYDHAVQKCELARVTLAAATRRIEELEQERDGLKWRVTNHEDLLDTIGELVGLSNDPEKFSGDLLEERIAGLRSAAQQAGEALLLFARRATDYHTKHDPYTRDTDTALVTLAECDQANSALSALRAAGVPE